MIKDRKTSIKKRKWKRINMRNVAHLMAVEFIHDLYNRHDPKITSIRFRNTITIWKNGIVNSYAPADEWNLVEEIIGHQYYNMDPQTIKNTKKLYNRKRKDFYKFIKTIQKRNLQSLSSKKIALLLINFQSIVLGELYVLNFVQIEHGLSAAIKKIISENLKDESKIDEVYMSIIKTEKATFTQKEKIKFYKIIRKWKLLKKLSLYNENLAKKDIMRHCEKFGYLYSAYGEVPKNFKDFWEAFEGYLKEESIPNIKILPSRLLSNKSRKKIKEINDKRLKILAPLLVRGGIFRDKNKALLGKSMKYRFAIIDEIARRKLEVRDNLNFYLLSEITNLLFYSQKVEQEKIEERKKKGVVFTRLESFSVQKKEKIRRTEKKKDLSVLYGQCASRGNCSGKCKIVINKEDINKVEKGDIMVAIGTDFDLIEAMYRADGVITEEGGILSHAAVVCRELSKPCCIGVRNATQLLKDEEFLKVNANDGKIMIIRNN